MSLDLHRDVPIIRHKSQKCVFQAKTPKGLVCVVAENMAEAAVVLHSHGFEVGMIQSVGELVE